MKNFVIEIRCQTASFRNPAFQNFHKTLELPPPTTIIGLAGAALGYSPLQAQDFFDAFKFNIGVFGTYDGKCKDTWKYNKGIRDMRLYNPNLDGSIIQKEFLIKSRFVIAFSSENKGAIKQLYGSFLNPVYALTMGNSDSLACLKFIESNIDEIEHDQIENCFVKGNIVSDVMSLAEKGNLSFSIYSNDMLTYDLPIRFDYESDYGKRSVSKIQTYSLIGNQMKINYKLKGLNYKNLFIPIFSI
jgi:CRISPR-associated protein Cas5t